MGTGNVCLSLTYFFFGARNEAQNMNMFRPQHVSPLDIVFLGQRYHHHCAECLITVAASLELVQEWNIQVFEIECACKRKCSKWYCQCLAENILNMNAFDQLRLAATSKLSDFGSVIVLRTNAVSIRLTSASRNVLSLPKNAIIAYRNCSVLLKIRISFAFCSERNAIEVQMMSRSGKLKATEHTEELTILSCDTDEEDVWV